MTYQVALVSFKGPLDLLVQLVERAKLDTTKLSLSTLTQQYLDHIEALPDSLDTHEAGGFAELAATLLFIKSSVLLPSADVDVELSEDVEDLHNELVAIGADQATVDTLDTLWRRPAKNVTPLQAPPRIIRHAPANITRDALHEAFSQALAKTSGEDTHKIPQAPTSTLHQAKESIIARCKNGITQLDQLFADLTSRSDIIATFLAALELVKQGIIHIMQPTPTSHIEIGLTNA